MGPMGLMGPIGPILFRTRNRKWHPPYHSRFSMPANGSAQTAWISSARCSVDSGSGNHEDRVSCSKGSRPSEMVRPSPDQVRVPYAIEGRRDGGRLRRLKVRLVRRSQRSWRQHPEGCYWDRNRMCRRSYHPKVHIGLPRSRRCEIDGSRL